MKNVHRMYDMRNIQDIKENIYITNYEEIKPNVYALINRVLCKTELLDGKIVSRQLLSGATMDICKGEYSEIILTTDQDLIKDGVQAIDDEFLEWFVKNPSCESVEVKCYSKFNDGDFTDYKIIIPKEEPKQETLEEAAEKYADIHIEKFDLVSADKLPYFHNDRNKLEDTFESGAKWKQERSYSEEEVLVILTKLSDYIYGEKEKTTLIKWFEQFKKK